jgi:hypothetical protein
MITIKTIKPYTNDSELVDKLLGVKDLGMIYRHKDSELWIMPLAPENSDNVVFAKLPFVSHKVKGWEHEYVFKEEDVDRFLQGFYYAKNTMLAKRRQLAEYRKLFESVLGIKIILGESIIVHVQGSSLKALEGYDIEELALHADAALPILLEAKKAEPVEFVLSFKREMKKLGVVSKIPGS